MNLLHSVGITGGPGDLVAQMSPDPLRKTAVEDRHHQTCHIALCKVWQCLVPGKVKGNGVESAIERKILGKRSDTVLLVVADKGHVLRESPARTVRKTGEKSEHSALEVVVGPQWVGIAGV